MYGVGDTEELAFLDAVIVAAGRCENGKGGAMDSLKELRDRAKELLKQHEDALARYYSTGKE